MENFSNMGHFILEILNASAYFWFVDEAITGEKRNSKFKFAKIEENSLILGSVSDTFLGAGGSSVVHSTSGVAKARSCITSGVVPAISGTRKETSWTIKSVGTS